MVIASNVTSDNRIPFECVSNSSQSGVGEITGLNGTALTNSDGDLIRAIISPFSRPGIVRVRVTDDLTANDQGIYTCTIPDDNGNNITMNVGLYPNGFNGEFLHLHKVYNHSVYVYSHFLYCSKVTNHWSFSDQFYSISLSVYIHTGASK